MSDDHWPLDNDADRKDAAQYNIGKDEIYDEPERGYIALNVERVRDIDASSINDYRFKYAFNRFKDGENSEVFTDLIFTVMLEPKNTARILSLIGEMRAELIATYNAYYGE